MIALLKKLKKAPAKVDPFTAYHDAIEQHEERHAELRRAAAGMMFARIKLEGELIELRAEIARLHSDARAYVRGGNERRALILIEEKRRLLVELEEREKELAELKDEAEEAALEVLASAGERRNLERERLKTIATLTVARARRGMLELRDREAAPRKDLEEVRAEVARISGESHLDRELSGGHIERELGPAFDEEGARAELAALRASLKTRRCA